MVDILSRAHGYQLYSKLCPGCGRELQYEREYGHQHFRTTGCLITIRRVGKRNIVFLECSYCGSLVQTRIKCDQPLS